MKEAGKEEIEGRALEMKVLLILTNEGVLDRYCYILLYPSGIILESVRIEYRNVNRNCRNEILL